MRRRFLLGDDHPVVREGLKLVIRRRFPDALIGEASSARGVLDAVRRAAWDLLLLDLTLPDRPGIEVLKDARAERPEIPVLVLAAPADRDHAARAARSGAAGLLHKDSTPDALLDAMERILAGDRYLSPALARDPGTDPAAVGRSTVTAGLSDREFEVLCELARAKTVSEIARSLHLSVKTVSTYRTRLLQKLGLRNNAELIRYAVEHRLVW